MKMLQDRIALIIGGAAGIGLASARALSDEGATVIIADRDGDAARHAADTIEKSGRQALAYRLDAGVLAELQGLFEFIDIEFGRLNILFSNAGVTGPNGFDVSEEDFDHVFNINVKTHFFATNYATSLLRRGAPHASVIYMSSGAGLRAGGRSPLYSISKASILMLARTFAKKLGPDGIRVNALCPGHVETNFPRTWLGVDEEEYARIKEDSGKNYPLGRIAQPSDVANVVRFLASDQSNYLTGLQIPIDGGLTA